MRKLAIVLCVILIVTCSVAIGILSQDVRWSYNREIDDYDHSTAIFVKNLYYVILILSAFLFSLSSRLLGSANIIAKRLCIVTHTCFMIAMIAMFIGIKMYPAIELTPYPEERLFMCLIIAFIPTICVYSVYISFLSKKSNEEHSFTYWMIPNWMIKTYHLKTNLRKRLFMVFIIYPLFYLALLPVIGVFVLSFYILPIMLILLIFTWIFNTISWIIEGRNIDLREKRKSPIGVNSGQI